MLFRSRGLARITRQRHDLYPLTRPARLAGRGVAFASAARPPAMEMAPATEMGAKQGLLGTERLGDSVRPSASVIKCKLPSHDTAEFNQLRCRGALNLQWPNDILCHVVATNGAFIPWVNRNALNSFDGPISAAIIRYEAILVAASLSQRGLFRIGYCAIQLNYQLVNVSGGAHPWTKSFYLKTFVERGL